MSKIPRAGVLALLLIVSSLTAQSKGMIRGQLPADIYLTDRGLEAELTGARLSLDDNTEIRFYRDHRYEYDPRDGATVYRGEWKLYDQGMVCVTFETGSARCDTYVRNAADLVLITSTGHRFRVVVRSPIGL